DYQKLREWTWFLYALMILALLGLFFTDSVQRVHRWYKIPGLGVSFQPSELAKLVVVIALSWFLERQAHQAQRWRTVLGAFVIVGIPFLLILKQPDLGSALVLFPVALVMGYFGSLRPSVIRAMSFVALAVLAVVALIFLEIVPHETIRPYASLFLKEYQLA